VESLSAYAQQFLDQMEKPNVDFIEGLSPAIAIEQRSAGANPRSTIATTTEVYDYLRVFFSAIGQPHDPLTGLPLKRQTPQQIVDEILGYEPGSRIIVLAPLIKNQTGKNARSRAGRAHHKNWLVYRRLHFNESEEIISKFPPGTDAF
jgi:excinuclease ABC subunit A